MYFTGQEYFCAAVGAIVAAFLAFLAWLAAHFFNDPNDSKADGSSGVETDKSAPGTPLTTSAERDDVIVAFGSWVTYRLDNQYYEMHPVQAWYLVCRGDSLFEKGTISPEACRFDTARLKVDDYERICRMVHVAETVDTGQYNHSKFQWRACHGWRTPLRGVLLREADQMPATVLRAVA